MKYAKNMVRAACLVVALFITGLAQEAPPRIYLDFPADTLVIPIQTLTDSLKLPHAFVVERSERLYFGRFKLIRGIHYRMDYRRGMVFFIQRLSGKPDDSLRVIYRYPPFPLIPLYYHQKLQKLSARDTTDTLLVATRKAGTGGLLDDLEYYQTNLKKSGSIVRGIQIGSNQDLTLNSGMNLQLSGYITPRVQIVAALTDESTPIQPEGNTQTLREVDKVFVKIISPIAEGTLGDFNLSVQDARYGNVQRKLQGLTVASGMLGSRVEFTYGTSRGTFHTNQFLGQEGKQGPYQLTGKNGEREIIVLAGTERVYVDGELQTRGENNDYIIDYSLAQITFTNKRLITSENRIEVDFEYSLAFQRYGKNFIGLSARSRKETDRFRYDVRLFREWDDTRNLLEDSAPLTDEERRILQRAGDDPLKAATSGAEYVGPGNGLYVKVDTVFAGQPMTIFKYVGPGRGDYRVKFSGVGPGKGDYRRVRLGVYAFVGPGRGEYLPIRRIPLAADQRLVDVTLGFRPITALEIQGELAVSQLDRNVFSPLDDQDNLGDAFRLQLNLQQTPIRLGNLSLGQLAVQGFWRKRSQSFLELDRPFQPQYDYKWNFLQPEVSLVENVYETQLQYRPFGPLRLQAELGQNRKGARLFSTRRNLLADVQSGNTTLALTNREIIQTRDGDLSSLWIRDRIQLSLPWKRFRPGYVFKGEDRSVRNDTGKQTGFRVQDHQFLLQLQALLGMDWKLRHQRRLDFIYNPRRSGEALKQAETRTYEVSATLKESKRWQGRLSLVYREKDYDRFFETLPRDSILIYQPDARFQDTTWQDRQSHLANLELRYRSAKNTFTASWDYQISSELQALREKVYIRVGENRGNYRYDESLGEYVPDPQGDYLLLILPSGKYESITRMESAWQITYRPRPKRSSKKNLRWLLQQISTRTYVRIEEQSRNPNIWDIYLLNLKKFYTPETTLRGSYVINQDIFLFERNPNWGIQLRSRYRDQLFNQFLDRQNNESRIVWDRIFQVRRRLFQRKINLITTYQNSLNRRKVSALPTRDRDVLKQALKFTLNYRPVYAWQLNLDVERGWEQDRHPANRMKVRYWELRPNVAYSMKGKARASADLNVIWVREVDNPFGRPIPFEMGKGKKAGRSWLLNLRLDYYLSSKVTVTVNYTGRRDAGLTRPIHLGKAEIRAFF
ncbi:MAG: hypothetical protein GXO78_05585 [Calditrichaeota bacterium]|nr:hypothetical protein [Calditrichota bacterium]